MKYNSIGEQLIAKAKELDPSYKPDKFNDMSEAINIILNNLDTYATFNDLHILDIGNITSSSNIYQTLYQNVYENDTIKKNVVIFSTEGFVDSATSLISSGEHIATPYQDNKILIDSVFVLNSDNSATTIISSDTVIIDLGELSTSGTLNSQILAQINNNLESKSITFTGIINGISVTTSTYLNIENVLSLSILAAGRDFEVEISLPDGNYYNYDMELVTTQDLKTINNTSLFGAGNIAVQEPLVSGTNIKTINGNSILGSGDLTISGGGNTDVIGFIESNPGSTLTDDKLQKLLSKKYGLYITGDMFFPTSEAKRFYTTQCINYFGNRIQLVYKSVSINQGNSLDAVSTHTIDLTTKNATDEEVNALFTNTGQPIPERAITLANLNAFKQQIENEINNEIGNVLVEGF